MWDPVHACVRGSGMCVRAWPSQRRGGGGLLQVQKGWYEHLERYKPERGASCIVRMWVGIMRCAIEDGELVSFREMTRARRRAWGHRACMHGDPACVPGPCMHGGDLVHACVCACVHAGIRYGHWDPAVTAEGQCRVRRHTMKRLSVRKK